MLEIEASVAQKLAELGPIGPFSYDNPANSSMARICYLLYRATNPKSVLETGIAFRVTSAYIIGAL